MRMETLKNITDAISAKVAVNTKEVLTTDEAASYMGV